MTIQTRHGFTSLKTDGADPTQVQPSHWNADHSITLAGPALVGSSGSGVTAAVEVEVGNGLTLTGNTLSAIMAQADKDKLNGIAAGATANATDEDLRDRASHTGEQAISTVTGLQTALDTKANAVAGPATFTTRALLGSDNGRVLVCATAQTATVDAGLPVAFSASFKGSILFTAGVGVTINDFRTPGAVHLWCSMVNTGLDEYDLIGGKA
jgi:hypothetical protein